MITQNTPSPERRFLELIPEARRSQAASLFYSVVQSGATDPAEVVAAVRRELQQRCARAAIYGGAGLRREQDLRALVTAALNSDPAAALDFARHVVERGDHYRARWMEQQPPTEKQIAFLRRLGYAGPEPSSKGEACRMIDEIHAAVLRRAYTLDAELDRQLAAGPEGR